MAPASGAQQHRFIVPNATTSRRARSIMQCRLTLEVLQPCLQRTLALQWQSREERACPPSMGPQHTQRASGLAPPSRAQHRRSVVRSAAPSYRVISIMPCRVTLEVLQPCLQRTLALQWQSCGERACPPSTGPQHTQRASGLAPASRAQHVCFVLRSVALSQRVRSIMPCCLTLEVLQPCLRRTFALQ